MQAAKGTHQPQMPGAGHFPISPHWGSSGGLGFSAPLAGPAGGTAGFRGALGQRNVGAGSERLDECVPAGKGERTRGWLRYGLNCVPLSNPCVGVLAPVPRHVTVLEIVLGK